MEESTRQHLIKNGEFMKLSPEGEKQLESLRNLGALQKHMNKKNKIESLALGLFERSTGFRFKPNLSDEKKEKIINAPSFKGFLDKATAIIEEREEKKESLISGKQYPVIKVPASGRPRWAGGARTMCFVYSKNHGNFILEGYMDEVKDYLKKYYTHYFCYYSMWWKGQCRGTWDFWKDEVGIISPSRRKRSWKWEVRLWSGGKNNVTLEEVEASTLYFKRLPHRWIPEFDKF